MRSLLYSPVASVILIGTLAFLGCRPTGATASAEDKEPHYLDGRRQLQHRDFEGAERSFHKALEANPRSSLSHMEIGLLYLSHKNDPAAAIYHLQRYLTLKQEAPNKTEITGHIEALKGDLAKEVLGSPKNQPGPIIEQLRAKLNQLAAENLALRHQLRSRGITPNPQPASTQGVSLPANNNTQPAATPPQTGPSRRHKVKSGQNPTSIARIHNVSLPQLLKANPGLNPDKLQIGQELIIPARTQ
tara:strand:+ start:481 stop:1215 length:735 start_codon:yes stop_codon:yes gene_type:complete